MDNPNDPLAWLTSPILARPPEVPVDNPDPAGNATGNAAAAAQPDSPPLVVTDDERNAIVELLSVVVNNHALGCFAEKRPRPTSANKYIEGEIRVLHDYMRNFISNKFPMDGYITCREEKKDGETGRTWIVVAMDGRSNYAGQMPEWGMLIACYDIGNTKPIFFAIQYPMLNACLSGGNGLETRYADVLLPKQLGTANIERFFVGVSTPQSLDDGFDTLPKLDRLGRSWQVRASGSATYDTLRLAQRQYDGVFCVGQSVLVAVAICAVIEAMGGKHTIDWKTVRWNKVITFWGGTLAFATSRVFST